MVAQHIRQWFDRTVVSRGTAYANEGRVQIVEVNTNGIEFQFVVYGTDAYCVSIEIPPPRREAIRVCCDCPYIESHEAPCKHIWAALVVMHREYPAAREWVAARDVALYGPDEEWWKPDPALAAINAVYEEGETPALIRTAKRGASGRRGRSDRTTAEDLIQRLSQHAGDVQQLSEWMAFGLPDYILQPRDTYVGTLMFHLVLGKRKRYQSGEFGPHTSYILNNDMIPRLPDLDRRICLMAAGAAAMCHETAHGTHVPYGDPLRTATAWALPIHVRPALMGLLGQTGRLFFRATSTSDPEPLSFDADDIAELVLEIDRDPARDAWSMQPKLRRGSAVETLDGFKMLVRGSPSYAILGNRITQVSGPDPELWLVRTPREPARFSSSEPDEIIAILAKAAALPAVVWPQEWGIERLTDLDPIPELALSVDADRWSESALATLVFHYGGHAVDSARGASTILDGAARTEIHRRMDGEARFHERLASLGAVQTPDARYRLSGGNLIRIVETLLAENWILTAARKPIRKSHSSSVQVTSGIDWFELSGVVEFNGYSADMAELLASARAGRQFVTLSDGSTGILPEKWLEEHGLLMDFARIEDQRVRFSKTQIGLIDQILRHAEGASFDDGVAAARRKLKRFNGIKPRSAPRGFAGELRDYQKDGLAWASFLREFEWGGCLADDMGLGKTIQVLALLIANKRKKPIGPALVVAPKSTIGNWLREAGRFAPTLRVLDYTGTGRNGAVLEDHDVVLTTYGTVLRDVETLAQRRFDSVVIDEAQAIKNPTSKSARAVRSLQARYRLALTGTPVENHLGDLWSIFEFLNPGMLGPQKTFHKRYVARNSEHTGLEELQSIVRPFILRRTKAQVATELPPRVEQTIECDLPPAQRKFYVQLRDHVRSSLLERIDADGLQRSKVHVLEALLRLRQAACHPALVDRAQTHAHSGKLDILMSMLEELIGEGHKALVFSQFTTLLSLVRQRLAARQMTYEYLDGRTQRRQEKIDHFQRDPDCRLFLISLKAGGVGLNLTAADYVFILDPWWNPAVEAQAIDRTHRIGQKRTVIAYRLIARDTVESRILELQHHKRRLAESIVQADSSLLRSLTRSDLEQLLT